MVRFRLYYDKEMETEYLNEMSRQGYAMTGFFAGFYRFDRCAPGEYIYQVDLTDGLFRVRKDYREFMREVGVEIVALWGPWVILRKKAAEGPFELYTDVESRIEHYEKIRRMFKIAAIFEIVCLFMEILGGLHGTSIAWFFSGLLGGILILIFKELGRLNRILAELKGRIGEKVEGRGGLGGSRRLSGVLALGLVLNGIVYLLPESGGDGQMEFLRGFLQGLALVFMLTGLVLTLWKRGE